MIQSTAVTARTYARDRPGERLARYRLAPVERTGALATGVPRRDPGTVRLTRVGVLIAALGALLVVIDPFGLAIAGLVLAVVGAVLAARGGMGHTLVLDDRRGRRARGALAADRRGRPDARADGWR